MPKTRQQRLAEERAGHPPSPPQFLEDKPRGPKRTRAKTPSATVAAGPVVPAAQPAVQGEPQALLYVWVDAAPEASGRLVDDPTHQMTIPSSLVPDLVTFIENIRNQNKPNEIAEDVFPKQPESTKRQTAGRLPNGRKSEFRRNPLLATSPMFKSQLVEASLDTSSAEGITTLNADKRSTHEATLTPETPRGGNWSIVNLISSAGYIKKRLGFSSLAPVSESPNSCPQTPTPSAVTTQPLTEMTAPTEPKKKGTSPTSVRDARAKSRRKNDSIIKRVKPATASKARKDRPSRAREASPALGGSEETRAEEEKVAIRWPSRSLDRMNQNKRKRWDEPVPMPSTESGYGNSDKDSASEEQPGKIRRTGESRGFSSQVAGDPKPTTQYQGGNVFAEYEAANPGLQFLRKTPIPTTKSTGTFKVPSPGDDDWSDSGSEEEEGNTSVRPSTLPRPQLVPLPTQAEALRKARAKFLKHKPRIPSRLSHSTRAYPSPPFPGETGRHQSGHNANPPILGANFTAFADWCTTAPPAVVAALETMEVDPNIAGNAFARGLEGAGAGHTNHRNAFEEWSKTASLAVTSAIENMEVDSILAGQAFISGLEDINKSQ